MKAMPKAQPEGLPARKTILMYNADFDCDGIRQSLITNNINAYVKLLQSYASSLSNSQHYPNLL
jgi:hypothetical protein